MIRIRGHMVDILVKIAPEVYQSYVTTDKLGNKVLLVECLNMLYGTMVASLLYYRKFTKSLLSQGYECYPYDPCVWNKVINGKQITICFHVDDCKISHDSSKVVDNTVELLRENYESISEDGSGKMKVHQGKVHDYLGMTIDFSKKGQVRITMLKYVAEVIAAWNKVAPHVDSEGFTTATRRKRTSAAPDDLFKVNEDAKKLSNAMAATFHNIVAKSLYLSKWARPNILVAIAFLTMRVRAPDVDDWRKLGHMVELLLGANNTGVVKWYVDASFAVHPYMRGHTGGVMVLKQTCEVYQRNTQHHYRCNLTVGQFP